jgi:gamma-glutamyl-gamma-aminobutyrate hydrolase PuuD
MSRPVIGICTALERARWSVWDQEAVLVPRNYLDAIIAAGGVPVVLPPIEGLDAEAALDRLDALLLIGGADVDPGSYGAERHPETIGTVPERDRAEAELVRVAWDRDLPFLGVCRGMQVLNVALGGSLVQHLPDVVGTDVHSPAVGDFGRHAVHLQAGSRIAGVVGEHAVAATHHHQAVDRLGDGLIACGWAEDEVVEAVELPGRAWTFGVQWHPEAHDGDALFAAFTAACAERRSPS